MKTVGSGLRQRTRAVASVVAITAVGSLAAGLPSAAGAEVLATNFCEVTLGHLGGPNDYCTSARRYQYNTFERGFSMDHSTCVSTTTNGAKSGVNVSWACSAGPWAEILNDVNQNVLTKSIIRNNTTGDSERVVGSEWWCTAPTSC